MCVAGTMAVAVAVAAYNGLHGGASACAADTKSRSIDSWNGWHGVGRMVISSIGKHVCMCKDRQVRHHLSG